MKTLLMISVFCLITACLIHFGPVVCLVSVGLGIPVLLFMFGIVAISLICKVIASVWDWIFW